MSEYPLEDTAVFEYNRYLGQLLGIFDTLVDQLDKTLDLIDEATEDSDMTEVFDMAEGILVNQLELAGVIERLDVPEHYAISNANFVRYVRLRTMSGEQSLLARREGGEHASGREAVVEAYRRMVECHSRAGVLLEAAMRFRVEAEPHLPLSYIDADSEFGGYDKEQFQLAEMAGGEG